MGISFKIDSSKMAALVNKLNRVRKPVDKKTAEKVARSVIRMMKELIASGNSPIAGYGRYPAYKNPKRYPGSKKPPRPVNLELTGKFLKALQFELVSTTSGYEIQVGYFDKKQAVKEQGHREEANGQPKRPTIPSVSEGERFANVIQKAIREMFDDRIKEILGK